MNPLRRLRAWLAGPVDRDSCVHGADPDWCVDCADRRGWQNRVFGHTTAETLPGEYAWVERIHDAYLGDEEAGS